MRKQKVLCLSKEFLLLNRAYAIFSTIVVRHVKEQFFQSQFLLQIVVHKQPTCTAHVAELSIAFVTKIVFLRI